MNRPHLTSALLLTGLLAVPMAVTAQQADHDHHAHGDLGARQAQPQPDHQVHGDHQGPAGHDSHAGHDRGARVTRGAWSYLDRDNPAPHERDRWVMVPIPGIQAGYRFVRTVDEADVCTGLDQRRIMVDRATREACTARPAAMPFQGVAMAATTERHEGHDGHGDHKAPGDHQAHAGESSPGSHNGHAHHHGPQDHHGDGHGDHGDHHHGDSGGHSWMAPPDAVAMANPVPATEESIRRGRAAYQGFCMSCHGADARGSGPAAAGLDIPPADLVTHLSHHTDGDYAWKIRTGNGPMPPFESVLTDRQIWDVVNYLRDLDQSR